MAASSGSTPSSSSLLSSLVPSPLALFFLSFLFSFLYSLALASYTERSIVWEIKRENNTEAKKIMYNYINFIYYDGVKHQRKMLGYIAAIFPSVVVLI